MSQSPFLPELAPKQNWQVIRRDSELASFDPTKITLALKKAFIAVKGTDESRSSALYAITENLTQTVVQALSRRLAVSGRIHIEDIQDQVELALMRSGEHDVARAYVLYREERAQSRRQAEKEAHNEILISLTKDDGTTRPLMKAQWQEYCFAACDGIVDADPNVLFKLSRNTLYANMPEKDLPEALILTARMLIERDPAWDKVAARCLLFALEREVMGKNLPKTERESAQKSAFAAFIYNGIEHGLLDYNLAHFDLQRLAEELKISRDQQFGYLGLQTLYDRYFLQHNGKHVELPQFFFMRVAMGLAINEIDREARAIEFYNLISSFDFMCSTPTLFNSGTTHPQLSSCYLTSVPDDLDGIFQAIKENALLQKYAGGLGNDWTSVRALGSDIRGTHGKSQGVIPFLKVANDTAVAVNQGGKRKGAVCAYLETWHLDIEEFVELRKNTGDERRRTHDMNTACWVPDLFMERVADDAEWTLFSPDETPDLHELYGNAFKKAYENYEEKAANGELRLFKKVQARSLWRKMLTMLFETGHPWITFKDSCNLRSPQQHVGVVHSSNLCTEITLNTSTDEIAVCNLGSINLLQHLKEDGLDKEKLKSTIQTAIRMLDNVIDINYYASPKARRANMRHRPIGMGMMGFADCLQMQNLAWDSEAAREFADSSTELISFYALSASCELAKERGAYSTFSGSLWDKGVLPIDSLSLLANARRAGDLEVDHTSRLDWETLRQHIRENGLRNSCVMAIAPTATIANIVGVSTGIEPNYQNLYVKSNLSGEFTLINPILVKALKEKGLWDEVMLSDLKYFDGSVQAIDRIPNAMKRVFKNAFEINAEDLIECAALRQKWIDQAQSLNLYLATPSGKKLDALYNLAWRRGLKSTYYLRSLGASQTEKNTAAPSPTFCSIDNPDCEACQ